MDLLLKLDLDHISTSTSPEAVETHVMESIDVEEQDAVLLTWSRTWLFVVLYFSAMASATALVPTNRVFQLWELKGNVQLVRGMRDGSCD